MSEIQIDTILSEFKLRVMKDEPISAGEWIDAAARVNALKGTLDNEVIAAEMNYNRIKSAYLLENKPNAQADTLARSSNEYQYFKELKAKQDRVIEFIRIAKARSKINEFNI